MKFRGFFTIVFHMTEGIDFSWELNLRQCLFFPQTCRCLYIDFEWYVPAITAGVCILLLCCLTLREKHELQVRVHQLLQELLKRE